MDNKKLYKRLSTFFWFTLSTCPFWISILCTLFSYFTQCPEGSTSVGSWISNLPLRFSNTFNSLFGYGTSFEEWVFPFIYSPIDNIIELLGLPDSALALCCAWFVQVYMLQLLLDIFIWLPKFIHNGLEKWGA